MKLIAWLLAGALALGPARVLRPSEDPYALAPTTPARTLRRVPGAPVPPPSTPRAFRGGACWATTATAQGSSPH